MRSNLSHQETERRRSGSVAVRLMVFFLVLAVLCTAGLYAASLLGGRGSLGETIGPGDPSLSPVERLALSAYLQARAADLSRPSGSDDELISFDVQSGETANQVALRLAQLGLVPDADLLSNYLRYNGLDSRIEAGHFTFRRTMTVVEIAGILGHATQDIVTLRIPEGWRAEQIAESLAPAGLSVSPFDFMSLLSQRPAEFSFIRDVPPDSSLEGFLFPDTYTFRPEAGAYDVLTAMLDDFDQRVTPQMRADAAANGLSLYQVVTLAAIVEREAVVPDEQPVIASVFLNRIAIGMKLDADPTVQYAVSAAPGWWKRPLTTDDLNFDSPYNTYLYTGLPPGPIANPGLGAIQAVIYHATTNYLYFRARCDGSNRHDFSETYEEHLQKGC